METKKLFIDTLVGQVRALDQFGTWTNKSNEDLLQEKYIRTKEDLKNIPIIADIDEMQIKDIRLIFQAVALAFEKITGVMASVVMEMSHEGFGRVVVFAGKIVLCEKFLEEEGEKFLLNAQETYDKYKNI